VQKTPGTGETGEKLMAWGRWRPCKLGDAPPALFYTGLFCGGRGVPLVKLMSDVDGPWVCHFLADL
jgi:hypothetical protein